MNESEVRSTRVPLNVGPEQARTIADLVGRGRGPLRIALGVGWCATALVDLPPLSRADAATVLARRAAAIAGVGPADVLFSARRIGPAPNAEGEGGEQRYLLAAASRARLDPILRELAHRGRRVVSVWPARMARLSAAVSRLGPAAFPAGVERDALSAIVVHVEPDAVVASLLCGELVLSQTVLDGSFERVPTLPLAVLQELRNLDAFHRKARRGARVAEVLVLGMEEARARLFENALRAALPGASLRFEPLVGAADAVTDPTASEAGAADGEGADSRSALIESASVDGPFSLDLRAPFPIGRVEQLVLSAALAAGCIGLAAMAAARFDSRSAGVQARLVRAEERSQDLPALEHSDQGAERAVVRLRREVERLAAIGAVGVDPGATLARLGGALPPGVLLGSLSLEASAASGDLGAIHLVGRVSPDPVLGYRALELLRERLEALPELVDVRVTPDAELDHIGDGRLPGLGFEVRAALEVSGS